MNIATVIHPDLGVVGHMPWAPAPWSIRRTITLLVKSGAPAGGYGPIPPGARWVTLHPNGSGSEGNVVLIVPAKGKAGHFVVHGGAGNKLNGLVLTGVKTQAEYDADRKEKRQKQQVQDAADRATRQQNGTQAAYEAHQDQIKGEASNARERADLAYIERMAPMLGIDKWRFEDTNDVPALVAKYGSDRVGMLRFRHRQDLIKQIHGLRDQARALLQVDDQVRQVVLAGDPNQPADNQLSLPDVLDQNLGGGLGYDPQRLDRQAEATSPPVDQDALKARRERLTQSAADQQDRLVKLTKDTKRDTTGILGFLKGDVAKRKQWLAAAETAEAAGDRVQAADQLAHIEANEQQWEKRLKEQDALGAVAQAAKFSALAQRLSEGVREAKAAGDVHLATLPDTIAQAKVVKALLVADKQHQTQIRDIRQRAAALSEDDQSIVDGAYVADAFRVPDSKTSDQIDQAVRRQVEGDVGTRVSNTLFGALDDPDQMMHGLGVSETQLTKSAEQHLADGAYSAINLTSLVATGIATMDRDAIAVLGIKGAAHVLAAHLHNVLRRDQVEDLAGALEDYHAGDGLRDAQEAIDDARATFADATQMKLDHDGTGEDFVQAALLSRLKQASIADGIQRLGETAGSMRGRAELIWALRNRLKPASSGSPGVANQGLIPNPTAPGSADLVTSVDVSGQAMLPLVRSLHALGLEAGDYTFAHDGDRDYLQLGSGSARKLCAGQASTAEIAQRQRVARILSGREDEAGWLPEGLSKRTRSTTNTPAGQVLHYGNSFDSSLPPARAIQDYVGGRVADGADVDDVVREMLSSDFQRAHVRDADAWQEALHDQLALPTLGDARDAHTLRQAREQAAATWADAARSAAGDPVTALQRQHLDTDDPRIYETMHRALSDFPAGVVAFKPIGQLTQKVKDVLRDFYVGEQTKAHTDRAWIARSGKSPDQWSDQERQQHAPHAQEVDAGVAAAHPPEAIWDAYLQSHPNGYAELLGRVRGQALERFAHHAAETMGAQLRTDRTAAGGVTIGDRAEGELGKVWDNVAYKFDPRRPVRLHADLRMDQDKVAQQRAIKMLDARPKAYWALGAGSGKTIAALGAFTHLHDQGKAKRGLFIVPSAVQGQFAGEALRTLDPSRNYKWYATRGGRASSRRDAYRDGGVHMVVVTPQGLRDDLHWAVSQLRGIPEGAAGDYLSGLDRPARAQAIRAAIDKAGWGSLVGDAGFSVADEAHLLSNRAGKDNSQIANVVDAIGDLNGHHVLMSGTPVKNDPSEAFDMLSKLDPGRYQDRDAFLRRYDSRAGRAGMQRELRQYMIADRISSGKQRAEIRGDAGKPIKLTDQQQAAYKQVLGDFHSVRQAHHRGTVDVAAMKRLSPNSFRGHPAKQHEQIAQNLQEDAGGIKEWAVSRVVNSHPWKQNAKIQHLLKLARTTHHGQPGVIFAHNLEAVKQISQAFQAEGHRVVTLTGADSAKDKDEKRQAFSPDDGRAPTADIMISSDAGAVGLNLQRGTWLAHHDVPQTSVVHEQRSARIDRLGQQHDVTIHSLVTDTPYDLQNERRLKEKADLGRAVQTPNAAMDDQGIARYYQQRRAARP